MRSLRQPWFLIPAAAVLLAGAGLCFVPLFNLLGYEFCFGLTLIAAPAAVFLGLGARRQGWPWRAAFAAVLGVLLPPLTLISLNAFRVQNCDFREGLLFFIALPVTSALYGCAIGMTIGSVTPPGKTAWIACGVSLLAPLGLRLSALYLEPQIFTFDHLWGHFAGSLYDETISLDARVGWWRAGTMLRVAALFMISKAVANLRDQRVAAAAALVGFLTIAWPYDSLIGARSGYRLDRSDIESVLSKSVIRPGLIVHLNPDTPNEVAELIADYHTFWLENLRLTLRVSANPVRSYIYRDRDQKARLMGGRGTMVAKPWLGEIHVHGTKIPNPVVAHELVHVVAAELGSFPLGVPSHLGVLVDMGIVEGLAEALTPGRTDYDLHYWVKALRVLDRAPDVRRLVAVTDFWRVPPERAYAVMGSFIRYLVKTRGADPIRVLYESGDFEAAMGSELDTIVGEWEQFIDGLTLSDRERRAAEERFRRGSIFTRVCAHEIAQLREEATLVDPTEAVGYYEQISEFLGESPNARFDVAFAQLRAGNDEEFENAARTLLEEVSLNGWRATQLQEELGRLHWKRGDIDRARDYFRAALEQSSTLERERLQWVRLWALDRGSDERDFFERFLSGQVPKDQGIGELNRWRTMRPDDVTLSYLLARQLQQTGKLEEALALLENYEHPFLPIETERLRLIASILEDRGKYVRAAEAYNAVAATVPRSGRAARFESRARWLRWRSRNH